MNRERAARAYNLISEGFAELSLAISEGIEQPAAGVRPPSAPAPVDDLPPLTDADYAPPRSIQEQHVENALSQCPDHQRNWRVVPAGISKRTGNSYDAFYACPEKDCKKKPVKAWSDAHPLPRAA